MNFQESSYQKSSYINFDFKSKSCQNSYSINFLNLQNAKI